MDTAPDQPPEETWDDIPEGIMALPTEDIQTWTRLVDNDIKVTSLCSTESLESDLYTSQVMKLETTRLQHEQNVRKEKIRDNGEKIKQKKVLPYLIGNVVEVRIRVRFRNTSRAYGFPNRF